MDQIPRPILAHAEVYIERAPRWRSGDIPLRFPRSEEQARLLLRDNLVSLEKDGQVKVKINGVDVFHPNTGEVRSDGPDGIACWFIDTDYNEESG